MNNMTVTKELKEDLKEFSVVMSMSVGLLVFALLVSSLFLYLWYQHQTLSLCPSLYNYAIKFHCY